MNKWTHISSYISLEYKKYQEIIELEKTYLKS